MNVVDHQLEVVAADVVVEAAQDRWNPVVAFLPGVQKLPLNYSLQLLRDNLISSRDIKTVGRKVVKRRHHPVHGATLDAFLQVFAE